MKCFVLLITIAIWQYVQVTSHPLMVVNLNPSEEIKPRLQNLTTLKKAIEMKEQENATKDKSNDEKEKTMRQEEKIDIHESDDSDYIYINDKIFLTSNENIQENPDDSENEIKHDKKREIRKSIKIKSIKIKL
nr:PREDICTED: uncharacterized protein LOC105677317 [Linepithema humile]